LIPDVAQIFNKLRATHKKSKIELADLEVILEILETSGKKTLQQWVDRLLGSCDRKKLRKMQARLPGAGNTEQVTASPTVRTQPLELKNYDINRGLSRRTIARLNVCRGRRQNSD
jgi:hypothetical protein